MRRLTNGTPLRLDVSAAYQHPPQHFSLQINKLYVPLPGLTTLGLCIPLPGLTALSLGVPLPDLTTLGIGFGVTLRELFVEFRTTYAK